MACKVALEEADWDIEKAIEIIQKKGLAKSAERAGRIATEGRVYSYVHQNRIAVLVEVNCQTDFAAREPAFAQFCQTVAMQVAAMNPLYVSPEEIPASDQYKQQVIFENQLMGKSPPQTFPKIIPGKFTKWHTEVCLLKQLSVEIPNKTIEQLVADMSLSIGEKVTIRRFIRWELGEGLEKKRAEDFADEVEKLVGEPVDRGGKTAI